MNMLNVQFVSFLGYIALEPLYQRLEMFASFGHGKSNLDQLLEAELIDGTPQAEGYFLTSKGYKFLEENLDIIPQDSWIRQCRKDIEDAAKTEEVLYLARLHEAFLQFVLEAPFEQTYELAVSTGTSEQEEALLADAGLIMPAHGQEGYCLTWLGYIALKESKERMCL